MGEMYGRVSCFQSIVFCETDGLGSDLFFSLPFQHTLYFNSKGVWRDAMSMHCYPAGFSPASLALHVNLLHHVFRRNLLINCFYSSNQRAKPNRRHLERERARPGVGDLLRNAIPWVSRTSAHLSRDSWTPHRPIIGPVVGGYVVMKLDWHFNFVFMFIFSLLSLISGAILTPETVSALFLLVYILV